MLNVMLVAFDSGWGTYRFMPFPIVNMLMPHAKVTVRKLRQPQKKGPTCRACTATSCAMQGDTAIGPPDAYVIVMQQ